MLLAALRQHGLKDTTLQRARCDTIRLKLLKIGAVVRVTVRRVWFSLAESCPYQTVCVQVFANLEKVAIAFGAGGSAGSIGSRVNGR